MLQNYTTDIGYTYYAAGYSMVQSVVIPEITNQAVDVVLATYLPVVNGQILNLKNTCPLPRGIVPRKVEIELADNTKYCFDIPFNSASALWVQLLTELNNSAIKSCTITGEKIPGYKLPLLLTKV
jgi:hypothetical protein